MTIPIFPTSSRLTTVGSLRSRKENGRLQVRTGDIDYSVIPEFKVTALLEKTTHTTITENFTSLPKKYGTIENYISKAMTMIIELTRVLDFGDFSGSSKATTADFNRMWDVRSKVSKLDGSNIDFDKDFNWDDTLQVERVVMANFKLEQK